MYMSNISEIGSIGLSIKSINTQKKLNCINLQLAIRILKHRSVQTCITRPPIFRPNLRSIGLLVIVQTHSKVISTDDGRTDIASDDIRYFLQRKNLLKTALRQHVIITTVRIMKPLNDCRNCVLISSAIWLKFKR